MINHTCAHMCLLPILIRVLLINISILCALPLLLARLFSNGGHEGNEDNEGGDEIDEGSG